MTHRERALAVLNRRKPDVVPWFGDLDYWATALIHRGKKPPDFKTSEAVIQAVYPASRHLSVKVRTFLDFLVKRLNEDPNWTTRRSFDRAA